MEEAPIAKPEMIWLKARHPASLNASARNSRVTTPMPSSPRLATASPITAPPWKAVRSAGP